MGEVVRKERLVDPGIIVGWVILIGFLMVVRADLWFSMFGGIVILVCLLGSVYSPIALIGRDGIILIKGYSKERVKIPRREIKHISRAKFYFGIACREDEDGHRIYKGIQIWGLLARLDPQGVMIDTKSGSHYILAKYNPDDLLELLNAVYDTDDSTDVVHNRRRCERKRKPR